MQTSINLKSPFALQSIQSARFSVQSSELGPPLTHKRVLPPPPLGLRGRDTLPCGEGGGGPNSDEGTDTLVLYVYYNPSTLYKIRHCLSFRFLTLTQPWLTSTTVALNLEVTRKCVGIYRMFCCPSSFEDQNETCYCEVQCTRKSYSDAQAAWDQEHLMVPTPPPRCPRIDLRWAPEDR